MNQPVSSLTGPTTPTSILKLWPWSRAHLCPGDSGAGAAPAEQVERLRQDDLFVARLAVAVDRQG